MQALAFPRFPLTLCALWCSLSSAAPAAAHRELWLVSVGAGATNRWLPNHVEEPVQAVEVRAGWGRPLASRLAWLATLDLGTYHLPGRRRAHSVGVTPHLRYCRGRLVVEGGVGFMGNDIQSEGYTYRYKWTPQVGCGVALQRTSATEVTLSWALVHSSHSGLTSRRNVGLNLHVLRLSWLLKR